MFQVPLATSFSSVTKGSFWNSVTIYHNRPHLVNRKIAVADQVLFYEVNFNDKKIADISDFISCHALVYEVQKLKDVKKENVTEDLLNNLLNTDKENVELNRCSIESFNVRNEGVFLSVRIILPRIKTASKCLEFVVLDKNEDLVTFFAAPLEKGKILPVPSFSYRTELTREGYMRITVNDFGDADTSTAEWLSNALFTKLMKWSDSTVENNSVQSLSRVPLDKYFNLYNDLKNKYGEPLRKVWWEKTKTDPQKFIFEDVAIASYLICLWDEEHSENAKSCVRFVDCGCGNGLLVYILNGEGFIGYGIDLRKRNVWELFDNTDLRMGAVEPCSVFAEATWLIGNHSDELTPWLPVIASKSSTKTNFFVLPCCPFDFNGKKYVRMNTAVSQYADYLEYIKNISEICEFRTSVDKLRIPSTKRICLIGIRENENIENMNRRNEKIEDFINSKLSCGNYQFTPRHSVERVRNCTQIDRNIVDTIVKGVVDILLMNESLVTKQDGSKWNQGGTIHLGELSKLLPKVGLQNLKKECGGLQTLLRNHRYLFSIEDANVSLRKPYKLEETSKYRSKPCWYYKFHPNGCLLDTEVCGYKHCPE